MSKKTDQRRTSDEDQSASEVRADDPGGSMDHLATLTRKVLKVPRVPRVPKEVVDQLREGSGVT